MAGMLGTAMMTNLDFSQGGTVYILEHSKTLATSDESKPSWAKAQAKGFSAPLVAFVPSARN